MTTATPAKRTPMKAALAGALGSALEYYDFFIYGSAAALVFPVLFFPEGNAAIAAIASLATFGVGYLVRPLGGFVFGHYGDRLGRKRILLITLVLMGLASTLIGFLPTYGDIGWVAPVALVVLRMLQGFSAGGELAGASTLTLEHSPEGRRGFFTSWIPVGLTGGTLIGTIAFMFVAAMPDEALYSWGWRVPFWASVIMLGLAYWVRSHLEETPTFTEAKAKEEIQKAPLVEVVRTQAGDVVRVMLGVLLGVLNTIVTVFGLSYATSEEIGIDRTTMLGFSVVYLAIALVTTPIMGIVADRVGRKAVMLFASIGGALTLFGYLWAISQANEPLVLTFGIIAWGIFNAAYQGVYASYFTEMFSAGVRYSGTSVGFSIGLIIAGFAPTIAAALLGEGEFAWLPVAFFAAGCLIVAAISVFTARETYKVPLDQLGKPQRTSA